MKVEVTIVNAFVIQGEGKGESGNPAGVVLDADVLSAEQKLEIAKQVGLSETAFVSQSKIADFKLDFYTPNRQIAHCGHATIATFNLLAANGLVKNPKTSKETVDGIREVIVGDNSAFMEQLKPRYEALPDYQERVLTSLNLQQGDVSDQAILVNTGNSFILVGVKDGQTLADIEPNLALIETISDELDLIGYYVFSMETNLPTSDASTRMFGPRYGITEEAGTGMAAGPLACYLYDYKSHEESKLKKQTFLIEQGYAMKPASPSLLNAKLEINDAGIKGLTVGGSARVSKRLTLEIE